MQKRILIWFYGIASLLTGCDTPLIIVKNQGKIEPIEVFTHQKFKIFQPNNWFYKTTLDTIRLDSLHLSPALKKYLLWNHQDKSEIIYRGSNRTQAIGNAFLCYQKTVLGVDAFTSNEAILVKKRFKINDIRIEHFSNLKNNQDTSEFIVPFVYPSAFMQKAKFNSLSYTISDKKDSFAVLECHIPLDSQKAILKFIYVINIAKYKKDKNVPHYWQNTFRTNALSWAAMIDTNPRKTLTIRNINNLYNYADSLLLKYGHQATLDSLLYLNNNYTQSTDFQSRSFYYQVLMTYYSFMGKNDSSLRYQEKAFNRQKSKDTVSFHPKNEKRDAIDFIAQNYGHQSVIMMNEAHNRGQNRHFAKQLLPALHKKGFRYLAVEGLSQKDSFLQQRGYPIYKSGIYIKEPAFGQLIREAIRLGFQLIAYESTLPYNPKLSAVEGQNVREKEQSKNIATILEKDPTAKILVYAGHGHIHKKTTSDWVTMGELLTKLLKYDIPSVECTGMMESFDPEKENPSYRKALLDDSSKAPFILLEQDTPFVRRSLKGFVTAQVFFPRTTYMDGYPNWLKETALPTYNLLIDNSLRDKHLLIYREEEWQNFKNEAIPVFQTTVQSTELKLYLTRGNYRAYIFKQGYEDVFFEKSFRIE